MLIVRLSEQVKNNLESYDAEYTEKFLKLIAQLRSSNGQRPKPFSILHDDQVHIFTLRLEPPPPQRGKLTCRVVDRSILRVSGAVCMFGA